MVKKNMKKSQTISPSSTSGEILVLTRRYGKERKERYTHTRRHMERVEEGERENKQPPK